MNCSTTEPISRLALELYHLGELPPKKQPSIENHLKACGACKNALNFIEKDNRPLPNFRGSAAKGRPAPAASWLKRYAIAWVPVAAAVIVGLVFTLRPPAKATNESALDSLANLKGGDTALTIVRKRAGVVDENPAAFQDGDKFKIFVTHLSNKPADWELAVFQGNEVYFPLTPDAPLMPGARVPLKGALSLDGNDPAILCIFIGENLPTRDRLRAEKQVFVQKAAACRTLHSSDDKQP